MKLRKATLKDKLWMKTAQSNAKKIMRANSEIWDKYGWEDGSMVKQNVLQRDLRKKFGEKKFKPVVAEILEDANLHSVNEALQEMGMVKYKGDRLKKYRKLGGKTWDIY